MGDAHQLPGVSSICLMIGGLSLVLPSVSNCSGGRKSQTQLNLETNDVPAAVKEALDAGSTAVEGAENTIIDPFGITWIFSKPITKGKEAAEASSVRVFDKRSLLQSLLYNRDGIFVSEFKDAYPLVMVDLKALNEEKIIIWLGPHEENASERYGRAYPSWDPICETLEELVSFVNTDKPNTAMVGPVTFVPSCPTPDFSVPEGYYATNNPYLVNGPKGFGTYRILREDSILVRLDLPGAARDKVKVVIEDWGKTISVSAEAPKECEHDSADRKYKTMIVLACDCCEWFNMSGITVDGVLRLELSKRKISLPTPSPMAEVSDPNFREGCVMIQDFCHTGPHVYPIEPPNDPALTGPELKLHPFLCQGPLTAYESKQLPRGRLYLRVDMPGVPPKGIHVSITNGQVRVRGVAMLGEHEFGKRHYDGVVAQLEKPVTLPLTSRRINIISKKNGVLRVIIPCV